MEEGVVAKEEAPEANPSDDVLDEVRGVRIALRNGVRSRDPLVASVLDFVDTT